MELFKVLTKCLIITCLNFLLINCHNKTVNYKPNLYENEYYIIDPSLPDKDYSQFLNNENISEEGDYLFKGKKISPFGDTFNDDSGIHVNVKPNINTTIYFFKMGSNQRGGKYVGKVIIKKINTEQVIKINRPDLEKFFEPAPYKILIFENNEPILRYKFYLLY